MNMLASGVELPAWLIFDTTTIIKLIICIYSTLQRRRVFSYAKAGFVKSPQIWPDGSWRHPSDVSSYYFAPICQTLPTGRKKHDHPFHRMSKQSIQRFLQPRWPLSRTVSLNQYEFIRKTTRELPPQVKSMLLCLAGYRAITILFSSPGYHSIHTSSWQGLACSSQCMRATFLFPS